VRTIGGGYKLHAFDRETCNLKMLGVSNVFALAGRVDAAPLRIG
jgi:hypothetical protein